MQQVEECCWEWPERILTQELMNSTQDSGRNLDQMSENKYTGKGTRWTSNFSQTASTPFSEVTFWPSVAWQASLRRSSQISLNSLRFLEMIPYSTWSLLYNSYRVGMVSHRDKTRTTVVHAKSPHSSQLPAHQPQRWVTFWMTEE